MRIIRHSACLLATLVVVSCGESSTSGGLASPVPAAKIHALSAGAENPTLDLRSVVEQLDSDDPAVRMTAITALQRATGETMGYRYYDDARAREAAVQRWVEAIEGESFPMLARGEVDG